MTNQQGAPEALTDPSPDQLRAIARTARNSSGSASDDCGPLAYVLHGWRAAAIAFRAQQAALVEAQQSAPSAAGRVKLPEPDTAETAAWTGWKVKYHSPDQIIGYGNQQFNAGRQFEAERLAALQAQQAAPSAAANEQRAGIPGNFITHRAAWRKALERCKITAANSEASSYWEHEIAAFDRSFDRLWALMQPSPTPQADSQPAPDEAVAMSRTRDLAEAGRWPSDWVEAYRRGYSDRAARAPTDSQPAPSDEAILSAARNWGEVQQHNRTDGKGTEHRIVFNVHRRAANFARELFAARAPADSVLEDADPLQGAANWLAEAHGQFCVAVLQGCLMIGYDRAKRLHDAAIAARKQGGA